jgi:hypothetical protein
MNLPMRKTGTLVISLIILTFIFFSCQQPAHKTSQLSPEKQSRLITRGKTIAMFSFKALSLELTKALNEGGVKHAVNYCNLHASQLIDSLSMVYKVKIFRVSDKYMNPKDKPDDHEMTIINSYKTQLADGHEIQPHLETIGNDTVFYAPILILNPLCLNCHGKPGSTMEQENYDFIKSRYPDDRAFGYKLGDLRGMWKIVLSVKF